MSENRISLRQLTVSALLIALDVVFSRVLAINTPLMKIGLGFAAVAVSAMLYGPAWAALTAALTGLLFGLFLYRREGSWLRAFLAALTNCFFVTLVLNTLLIAVFFRSSPQELAGASFDDFLRITNFRELAEARSLQFLIMTAVQTVVIGAIQASPALLRLIREKSEKKP